MAAPGDPKAPSEIHLTGSSAMHSTGALIGETGSRKGKHILALGDLIAFNADNQVRVHQLVF
jgi:hypothetical protein